MGAKFEENSFLDATERSVVARAFAVIGDANPEQCVVLRGVLGRLRKVAELVHESPSIASWRSGGRVFTEQTLVEELFRIADYDVDLHVPTKAVFGQAFLVAKINFLKAVRYSLEACGAPDALVVDVDVEIGQSVYTKLAEELFISIVTDPLAPDRVKTGAARFLFRIWEERLLIEVDDFAPVLESAWEARSKLLPVLGTMLGTHEIFRLFQEARDHRFLEYFGESHVEEEQMLAFEEFLFALSYEEISELRAHLAKEGRSALSVEEARAVLGERGRSPVRPNKAQSLYASYKRRRVNAAHRALTGAPGPKKTAEEYVMIAFLDADASAAPPERAGASS